MLNLNITLKESLKQMENFDNKLYFYCGYVHKSYIKELEEKYYEARDRAYDIIMVACQEEFDELTDHEKYEVNNILHERG